MAEPFLSEIRIMSFVFAPKGWALCNGQLLPINQNQAPFSLLGTTFGGDGSLFDLKRRRIPGPPKHAAVLNPLVLHRPAGHLPITYLKEKTNGTTICWRNQNVRGQLCPSGLDVLRRATVAHLGKRNAFPIDRHYLRRRRRINFCASRSSGTHSHSSG